jgi:hypothetical protein
MCSKAVLLAAVLALVLGAGQTVTRAFAVEHGGGVVTGSHFGYGSFGHHGRKHHRIAIIPYSGDWSDSDYDEAPTYGNNAVYPPPASAVAPAAEPSCHRTSETFNVPSADGGTREITVIGCP